MLFEFYDIYNLALITKQLKISFKKLLQNMLSAIVIISDLKVNF